MNSNRLLLVDGNSIMNRSYFALAGRSNLTALDGTPTGALHAYLNTLHRYITEFQPTHICTLFDRREKTFRHEKYPEYKAKRHKMDEDLVVQMPLIKDILDALGQARYELAGYEADDLIGTYAHLAQDEGFEVRILTGDKDDFQLINDRVSVWMPPYKADGSPPILYDREVFRERYAIDPEHFITYKALLGDNSDNIPGVPGIGEKGAATLVQAHPDLDELYANLETLPPTLRRKLEANRDLAYLSYTLSEIVCDVPVEIPVSQLQVGEVNAKELAALFSRLGLKSQMKKWIVSDSSGTVPDLASGPSTEDQPRPLFSKEPEWVCDVDSDILVKDFLVYKDQEDFYAVIDVPFLQENAVCDGYIVISFSDQRFYGIAPEKAYEILEALANAGLGIDSCRVYGHCIKNRWKGLERGLPFLSCFDVEIAGYLLNRIDGASVSFEQLYERTMGEVYPTTGSGVAEGKGASASQLGPLEQMFMMTESVSEKTKDPLQYMERSCLIRRMAKLQTQQIKDHPHPLFPKLVYEIEMPLVLHLDRMERAGILVDVDVLEEIHERLDGDLRVLSQEIYEMVGKSFNLLSPKQLSEVLYDTLQLPGGKKSGSSGIRSTSAEELDRLSEFHPVVDKIKEYRQLSKLDSTFVVGMQKVVDRADERIHSNFSQAMTSTGRLSSSEPNLQNIPVRTETGRLIRTAFRARPGYVLVDADYSQIELRLLAHLSGDEVMVEAFQTGEDIHVNTAATIFGVGKDLVTSAMRSAAKTVNFSIIYGISAYGLSRDLGITVAKAQKYIDQYYVRYPQIKSYLDSLKTAASECGFVETMFGRRRVVKELSSPNRNVRAFGERAAMNTPIQGTAADIIKIAMNRVGDALMAYGDSAVLILQVHDELLVECREDLAGEVVPIVKNSMENAVALSIPLLADVSVSDKWKV